jgi:hypothetical protein
MESYSPAGLQQRRTAEQKLASAAKGIATRRAGIAAREAHREDMLRRSDKLWVQIAALEARIETLQRAEIMSSISAAITGKRLLRCDEIVSASQPWLNVSGVYFLIAGTEVVYVGQSVGVFARIQSHTQYKNFDRFAFVPCAIDALDKLESLYIHLLEPRLNGNQHNGAKCAPITLDELLGLNNGRHD